MFVALFNAQTGHAQPYPAKPIRLVLPYPPGGLSDVIARTLAQKMGDTLGQPLVIENVPGAGSTVGTSAVARAAPNGYTLLFAYSSGLTIGPGLYAKPGYDPLVSFVPIGTVARFFHVLGAHSSLPAANVRSGIQSGKLKPLAVTTPAGLPEFREIQTITEAGICPNWRSTPRPRCSLPRARRARSRRGSKTRSSRHWRPPICARPTQAADWRFSRIRPIT